MSKVEALLRELAPTGVPYLSIGDPQVSQSISAGATPSSGRPEFWQRGTIPWMSSGEVNKGTIFETEKSITQSGFDSCSTKMIRAGAVVIALAGQGKTRGLVARTRLELCTNQSLAAVTVSSGMNSDFLYYYLQTQYANLRAVSSGDGTRGGLTLQMIRAYKVPVPPLDVQREIVRILDTFSQLDAELEAELEARRVQYSYYRDSLLELNSPDMPWIEMGEVGYFFGGLTGKSKADFSDGNAKFVTYLNIAGNISVDTTREDRVRVEPGERQRSLMRGDILFTGSSETPGDVGISSVVTAELEEPVYLNSFSIGYRLNDPNLLNPDFAKHLFRSSDMRAQIVRTASGVTRFNVSKARLAKVRFPVPSPTEQTRIAATLDRFERLVNSLSDGLPAELHARRQQYEYYRDKLLTFDEMPA